MTLRNRLVWRLAIGPEEFSPVGNKEVIVAARGHKSQKRRVRSIARDLTTGVKMFLGFGQLETRDPEPGPRGKMGNQQKFIALDSRQSLAIQDTSVFFPGKKRCNSCGPSLRQAEPETHCKSELEARCQAV